MPELEIVVVDDASRDVAAVAAAVADAPRARLVRGAGRGPAAARNAGVAAARAPVVCFTDDDCEPVPGWAAALAACLGPGPDSTGADAAAGPTRNGRPRSVVAAAAQAVATHLAEATIDAAAGCGSPPPATSPARRGLRRRPVRRELPARGGRGPRLVRAARRLRPDARLRPRGARPPPPGAHAGRVLAPAGPLRARGLPVPGRPRHPPPAGTAALLPRPAPPRVRQRPPRRPAGLRRPGGHGRRHDPGGRRHAPPERMSPAYRCSSDSPGRSAPSRPPAPPPWPRCPRAGAARRSAGRRRARTTSARRRRPYGCRSGRCRARAGSRCRTVGDATPVEPGSRPVAPRTIRSGSRSECTPVSNVSATRSTAFTAGVPSGRRTS